MKAPNYYSPIVTTLLLIVLQACASSGTKDATGAKAASNLDRGRCPSSIVSDQGKDSSGRIRYQRALNSRQLSDIKAREISNCTRLVRAGNTEALATLVSYYDANNQKSNLVELLETYTDSGTDSKKLADAGTYLYRAYAGDTSGVVRDVDKAFKYLGIAVNNGNQSLELAYAESLTDRGLHNDLLRYLLSIAGNSRKQQERCQATLNLGQLYFGGSPAHENWNIGYYYWQEGLLLAKNPKWGSCAEDNFTSTHYSRETGRKKFVDRRIALMSSAQRQVIDEARRDSHKGYDFIAALNFQRPSGVPVANKASRTQVNNYLPGWAAWSPTTAQLCSNLKYSGRELRWNEVFEANVQAIWTVNSRNGNSKSQGSAVAVSPSELITNCHLIENPKQITIRRMGWSLPARLKASDREGDRCILEVGNNLPAYVRRGRSYTAVKIGEDVAAIGNPKGLETSLSRGIVGQKRSRGGLRLIQTDAAISSGSSGGGLFDRSGYLMGITTFTISGGQSLNFAIAIDEFCR